jgi:hypothetical protein
VNSLLIRLCGIVGLLSVSLIVLGIFHVQTLNGLDRVYSKLLQNDLARLQLIQQVTAQTFSLNRNCLNLLVTPSKKDSAGLADKIKSDLILQARAINRLKKLEWPDRKSFDDLEFAINAFSASVKHFLVILPANGYDAANDFRIAEMRPQMDHLNEVFGELALFTFNDALLTNQESSSLTTRNSLIGLMLAGWPFVVVAAGVVWSIIHLVRYFTQAKVEDELPV